MTEPERVASTSEPERVTSTTESELVASTSASELVSSASESAHVASASHAATRLGTGVDELDGLLDGGLELVASTSASELVSSASEAAHVASASHAATRLGTGIDELDGLLDGGLELVASTSESAHVASAPHAATRLGTGVDELDGLLGGGLVRGETVHLYGPPGVGKSSLCARLAVLMQLHRDNPANFRTLFVTDSTTYVAESLASIARHAVSPSADLEVPQTVEGILKNIDMLSVHKMGALLSMPTFIECSYMFSSPHLCLLVLDNIQSSFPPMMSTPVRNMVGNFLKDLKRVTSTYRLATVVGTSIKETVPITPVLGTSFDDEFAQKIELYFNASMQTCARLPGLPERPPVVLEPPLGYPLAEKQDGPSREIV